MKVTINTYQTRIQQNFILKGNFANFFEKSDLISTSEENEGGTQCLKITEKVSFYDIASEASYGYIERKFKYYFC